MVSEINSVAPPFTEFSRLCWTLAFGQAQAGIQELEGETF